MADDTAVELIGGGLYPAWCGRCWSSSAARMGLYVLGEDGPRWVGLWFACEVCDPDRFGDGGCGGDDDGGDVMALV